MSAQPLTTNASNLKYPYDVSGATYRQQYPSDVLAATRQIMAAKTAMPVRYYFPQSNDYRLTILDGRFLLGCFSYTNNSKSNLTC